MNTILTILVILVAGYLMRLIYSQSQKPPLITTQGTVLRLDKSYYLVSILSAIFGLLFLTFSFFYELNLAAIIITWAIGGYMFLGGMYFFIKLLVSFTVVSDEKIYYRNWLGKETEIFWKEIIQIDFKSSLYMFLKSKDKKIPVYMLMRGFNSVIDQIKTKLDAQIYEESFKKMKKLKLKRSDIFGV